MGEYKYKVSVVIPAYNAEEYIKRAIESVPARPDVEVIVVDDGSTDKTVARATSAGILRGAVEIVRMGGNYGVAAAVNAGIDETQGEYIVLLGSDDYLYTEEFERAMEQLDDTDLVYFDLKINDGNIFHLSPETKENFCGSVKFMRSDFVGETRNDETKKAGEDWFFYQELLRKNPTEKFTGIVAKHYNYPREGSLSWQLQKGIIKKGE